MKAVIVDEREPAWVAKADYGAPAATALLVAGDVWVATDDDALVIVERKTWNDLLASIGDGRLFHQVGAMAEQSDWCYVVITEPLEADRDGRVNSTGWRFSAVWGALLTVQECGAHVLFCNGQDDFAPCVQRLAKRNREQIRHAAPRQSAALGPSENFLAALPGIGPERALRLLQALPAWSALEYLTDPTWNHESIVGIGDGIKKKVREILQVPNGSRLTAIPFDLEGENESD